VHPGPANHYPGLRITWDRSRIRMAPAEAVEALRSGEPCIEVSAGEDTLNVAVVTLRPEHVDIVGRRVREVLEQVV
jgi:hypothetical protein